MKIEILVRVNSQCGTYAAAVDVPDYLVKSFAPVNTNDDPLFNLLDPTAITRKSEEIVIKIRESAAEELSNMLTEHIMKAMEAEDTHNGYKINHD
jgi:hypothetical protein